MFCSEMKNQELTMFVCLFVCVFLKVENYHQIGILRNRSQYLLTVGCHFVGNNSLHLFLLTILHQHQQKKKTEAQIETPACT